jgi:hypothetical protein
MPEVAYACPAYMKTAIKLTPLYGEPSYDHSLDIQSISLVSHDSQFKDMAANEIPMGFTETVQSLETSYKIVSQDQPDGSVCAQISDFELRFGFPKATVFVAKELAENSCGYNEILSHEMKHVRVNREIVKTYLPRLGSYMPNFMEGIGVISAGSTATADQRFHDLISQYMKRLLANMTTVYNDQQKVIDTPEEYQRLSAVCDGSMAKMLGRRGQ